MDLQQLLTECAKRKASDLHLKAGARPILRVHGHLEIQDDLPPVDQEFVRRAVMTLLGEQRYDRLMGGHEIDIGYRLSGIGRFRVNAFLSQGEVRAVFRHVPERVPSFQELCLPKVLERLCMERRGMIVVTGITGSGKSTTLAAMISFMNRHRNDHVVTIEDPIEYVHEDGKCVITQREIGQDSVSFAQALRAALREDPDIILVGEMRDVATMEVALHAAETGHLVLSTLHTLNATETINRVISTFPPHQEDQIRNQLAAVIQLPEHGHGVGGLASVGQPQHGSPDGPVGGPVEVGFLQEGGDLGQQPARGQDRSEYGLLSLQVVRRHVLGHRA